MSWIIQLSFNTWFHGSSIILLKDLIYLYFILLLQANLSPTSLALIATLEEGSATLSPCVLYLLSASLPNRFVLEQKSTPGGKVSIVPNFLMSRLVSSLLFVPRLQIRRSEWNQWSSWIRWCTPVIQPNLVVFKHIPGSDIYICTHSLNVHKNINF